MWQEGVFVFKQRIQIISHCSTPAAAMAGIRPGSQCCCCLFGRHLWCCWQQSQWACLCCQVRISRLGFVETGMPKHVLNCLCLMPIASGLSVAVWCHLQHRYRHVNCLTHCALCSHAQLKLKQAQTCSNSAMCQIVGMLLQAVIWYPGGRQARQSWDSRGTHAAA